MNFSLILNEVSTIFLAMLVFFDLILTCSCRRLLIKEKYASVNTDAQIDWCYAPMRLATAKHGTNSESSGALEKRFIHADECFITRLKDDF